MKARKTSNQKQNKEYISIQKQNTKPDCRLFLKSYQKRRALRSVLSIILSVSILLTLLPANAFASTGTQQPASVVEDSEQKASQSEENQQEAQEEAAFQKEYETKGCLIKYNTADQWGSYANVEISIQNQGEETLEDWELQFPYDATMESIWNAEMTVLSKGTYRIIPEEDNKIIKKGESISFGFIAKAESGEASAEASSKKIPCAPENIELQGDFIMKPQRKKKPGRFSLEKNTRLQEGLPPHGMKTSWESFGLKTSAPAPSAAGAFLSHGMLKSSACGMEATA